MTTFSPSRATLHASHTLRMLGENVTLTGWQWTELAEELREDSELRGRIMARLATDELDSTRAVLAAHGVPQGAAVAPETCGHGVALYGPNGEYVDCDGCD